MASVAGGLDQRSKGLARSAALEFPGIQALTFDFYETLVYARSGRGRGQLLMEYLRRHRLESDPWEHQVLYDIFETHHTEYSPGLSPRAKQRYLMGFTDRLFRRLNVKASAGETVDHASDVWRLLGPDCLAVFPEVGEVLGSVREAGYPVALVSNWQCGLRHFCTELGLADFLDHILASAEVGSAKPDSRIFGEACRLLDAPPHRVLHIGDSLVDDFEGATGAGLQALLVRREPETLAWEGPCIGSLDALPRLLDLA